VYKQLLINAKLKTGKRGQKTELTGRSVLKRRRSALGCSAIKKRRRRRRRKMRRRRRRSRG